MKITKTFVNAFPYVFRAKMRAFFSRSIFRYALGSLLIALAFHFTSLISILSFEFLKIWGLYLFGICIFVIMLLLISTYFQSRRHNPQEVTFTEESIVTKQNEQTVTKSWDWIIAAQETAEFFAFLVQKRPRLELFIDKDQLNDDEYQELRGWLVKNGKLSEIIAP